MSHGSFSVVVPHFCGERLRVQVDWSQSGGTRLDPPDYDEQWSYFSEQSDFDVTRCPKCGVDLDYDDLFQVNVQKAADKQYADSEDPSEPDWEPSEEEYDRLLWESDQEFHRSGEMPF